MKQSRKTAITNKIISKKDIINIAKAINPQYEEKENQSNQYFSIILKCSDGTSYESECLELFEEGNVIDYKSTEMIEIFYKNRIDDKTIILSLYSGNENSDLIVRGNDSQWVNGQWNQLNEMIISVKPQFRFGNFKWIMISVLALIIGYTFLPLLFKCFDFLFHPISPSTIIVLNPIVRNIIFTILYWSWGLITAIPIVNWTEKLWPSIEFDFGPTHFNKVKLRRMKIGAVLSLVILPIIINIISGYIGG